MMRLIVYVLVGFLNVFLHTGKNIVIIKHPSKLVGSLANCICYTFSAVVIKFIAEYDLLTALLVQAATNFLGCYTAMYFTEKLLKK
jgi:hypothetical protein